MMIITPAYPSVNSSYTVSKITLNIIRKQIQMAFQTVNLIKQKKKDWKELFFKYNLFKEYNHFLEISIVAQKKEEFVIWRGHVESKMRKMTKCLENSGAINDLVIHPYPIPIFNKDEDFCFSVSYYYGLKCSVIFNNNQERIINLKMPMLNFINYLDSFPKSPDNINLKIKYLKKSEIPEEVLKSYSN